MAKIKRKYIDSHWLVFAVEGVISLLFGWYVMFSGSQDATYLSGVIGWMLLTLGLIELFNVLHRKHLGHNWGLSLTIAIFEILAAFALLLTLQQNSAVALSILSGYTLIRGIFEILISAKSIDDSTDKFIWLICGICGIIFAFVVLNSGHFTPGTFVKFFGSYLTILGLSNLIYGAHNRDQKHEDSLARKASRKGHSTKRK